MRLPMILAVLMAAAPGPAFGHGSMEVPISRVYGCYKEGPEATKSAACQAAVAVGGKQPLYDWNEVNQGQAAGNHRGLLPAGRLCSGGRDKYAGFDLLRNDWPTTALVPDAAGRVSFTFHATAVHATSYFDLYVTRSGWSPLRPLAWSDLIRFASIAGPTAVSNRYRLSATLPAGVTGRHLIFAVWQRSDSPEAFYSCSDVTIATGGGGSTGPTFAEVGRIDAPADLPAGSTVSLRVFDAQGRDAARHTVTLTAATGTAARWPQALAQAVNAASDIFRIGVQGAAGITPVAAATGNRVYRSSAFPGYAFEIDTDTPAVGGGAGTWREGASYVVGQTVTYQGRTYRCLQAHTAWVGAGWTPATTPALWQPLT